MCGIPRLQTREVGYLQMNEGLKYNMHDNLVMESG